MNHEIRLISPDGALWVFTKQRLAAAATGLSQGSISQLVNSVVRQAKGWRKATPELEKARTPFPVQPGCGVSRQQWAAWHSKDRSNNTTGYRGVSRKGGQHNKPFTAVIRVQGRSYYLGSYQTAEEAHTAYQRARTRYYTV